MATNYELYLGGPRQQNTDWAIFPAAPFNALNAANLAPPNKHPVLFGASRTLDFVNDTALKYFLKKNVTLPMVNNDSLGLVVIPSNSLIVGAWWKVSAPVAGATGTASLKLRVAGKTLASGIALNAVGSGFGIYDPAAAITNIGTIAAGLLGANKTPDILDLIVTAVPTPATLAGLVMTVTPVYYNFQAGMMN